MTAKTTSCWARHSSLRRGATSVHRGFPAACKTRQANGLERICGNGGRPPQAPIMAADAAFRRESPARIAGAGGRGRKPDRSPLHRVDVDIPRLDRVAPSRARAVAHHADGIELGLLVDVVLGPLANLVALAQQLDL